MKMFDIDIPGIIGKVLGVSSKDGSSQLLELFKGQKQKQREFELEIKKVYQVEMDRIVEDRVNARKMQMAALNQNDLFSKRFTYYLAAGLLTATVFIGASPMFLEIPVANKELANRATDFFFTVSGATIISFFFGASKRK